MATWPTMMPKALRLIRCSGLTWPCSSTARPHSLVSRPSCCATPGDPAGDGPEAADQVGGVDVVADVLGQGHEDLVEAGPEDRPSAAGRPGSGPRPPAWAAAARTGRAAPPRRSGTSDQQVEREPDGRPPADTRAGSSHFEPITSSTSRPEISRKKRPLPTTSIMPPKTSLRERCASACRVARRLLVEDQRDDAHHHDPAGRGVEDVLPVPAAHDAGHDRAEEAADVDHHVEDAEAHAAGLLVGGLGHRA